MTDALTHYMEATSRMRDRAETAEAEVARLRAGLQHIQNVAHSAVVDREVVSHWWYRQAAIRLLAGTDQ